MTIRVMKAIGALAMLLRSVPKAWRCCWKSSPVAAFSVVRLPCAMSHYPDAHGDSGLRVEGRCAART